MYSSMHPDTVKRIREIIDAEQATFDTSLQRDLAKIAQDLISRGFFNSSMQVVDSKVACDRNLEKRCRFLVDSIKSVCDAHATKYSEPLADDLEKLFSEICSANLATVTGMFDKAVPEQNKRLCRIRSVGPNTKKYLLDIGLYVDQLKHGTRKPQIEPNENDLIEVPHPEEQRVREWLAIEKVQGKFCPWWHDIVSQAEDWGIRVDPLLTEIAMLFDRVFPGTSNRFKLFSTAPYVTEQQLLDYLYDRHDIPPQEANDLKLETLAEILRKDWKGTADVEMVQDDEGRGDSLPRQIWSVADYYQAKEFYEKRRLVFNPALERGSPAAHHVIAQAQLKALRAKAGERTGTAPKAKPRRFRVALSFPGEHRDLVRRIATCLADQLEQGSVFYDHFHKAELARPDLDTYLQQIYHDDSDLLVVFICADYEEKEWCGLEWRAIRDLIKKRRTADIMPIRVGKGDVTGLFSIDGYINADDHDGEELAKLIIERLRINESLENP